LRRERGRAAAVAGAGVLAHSRRIPVRRTDQVESELELVGVVVAGLEDVLRQDLDKVGVLVGSDLLLELLGDRGNGFRAVEG
jgi:hypothetical protein